MAIFGNRGKLSERLKRILLFRKKKINNKRNENIKIEDSNEIYMNFIKVMAAVPGVVSGTLSDVNKIEDKKSKENNVLISRSEELKGQNNKENNTNLVYRGQDAAQHSPLMSQSKKTENKSKRQLIEAINVNLLIERQSESIQNSGINETDQEKIQELEKNIINLIKKDLIKIVNEMEILQSELYILSEVNGENKVLIECQRELDQVKNMLCKIDKLKEQYDFLSDNYDFEYLLEIDNNDLVDKIIELRDSFGKEKLKDVSTNYKLLDVYRYLYLKIDDLQEKTTMFEEKKEEELASLKERDIDFQKLQQTVYNVEDSNKRYNSFVDSQNAILHDIDNNMHKINSYEVVNYHLKGFNELFRNSCKYFGLLMISPLKGIIPSIATETLITGNLIKNLYSNLAWEEQRQVVYETIDYSNMISCAINDLEETNRIVDMTLEDIVRLKIEYNERFKKYQGDFSEYREIMQKISDMENKILGNKIKIEIMRKRALDQKRMNDKKLIKVNELNQRENQK